MPDLTSLGQATLVTGPIIEPISLAELKLHLRLDSGTLDDNLTLTQSLAFASHAIAANYTTHVGTGVDVLGKEAIVILSAGTNGATGTNDTRIEDSDDNVTFTAWTGGAFTQVTTDGAGATEPDNADYKIQYTGTKQYIRTASKVLLAACEFGTSILVNDATFADDTLLTDLIAAARAQAEYLTQRALLTQTWDYYLDAWPNKNYIRLPYGNLQNAVGTAPVVTYTDSDGTVTTMTVATQYIVEQNGKSCGRIVLPYGVSWPIFTAYPSKPIKITFVCGWTTAALVPSRIKAAIKMICSDLYENREAQTVGSAQGYLENKTVTRLLTAERLWDFAV